LRFGVEVRVQGGPRTTGVNKQTATNRGGGLGDGAKLLFPADLNNMRMGERRPFSQGRSVVYA